MEIMNDRLKKALLEAVTDALENMVFEEVDLVDDTTISGTETNEQLWAILPIIKPLSGEMVLSMTRECAQSITKNIYGTSEAEKLDDGADLDALAEILNTIAGRFVHALLPSNQGFDLGLPKTGRGTIPVPLSKTVTSISINAGGHFIRATVFGEEFLRIDNYKS
jgi:CheY-specific phosphatase CheX